VPTESILHLLALFKLSGLPAALALTLRGKQHSEHSCALN